MKVLNLRQAASVVGVHHATLSRWIRDGEGPKAFIKPGRRIVIRINEVDLKEFIRRYSHGGR